MINKLRKFFYTTYLGELYFRFLLWQDHRKFRKDIKNLDLTVQQILINRQSELYKEGVKKIKTKVNNLVASKTSDEYDKTLKGVENLLGFSKHEGEQWSDEIDLLYKSVTKTGADIKNDTDMAKMVEERIQHKQELWRYHAEKQLVRQIRKAKQENNLQLATQLEEEWKGKYAKSRR